MMEKVILYGVDGCHKCKFMGEMLKKRDIPYEKVSDVDTIIAMKLDSVPAMVVGDKVMYETDALAWLAKYTKE